MALHPSSSSSATASHSAAHAIAGAHAKARPRLGADEGEDGGGGFAAQLLRAQPTAEPDQDVKTTDKPKPKDKVAQDGDKDVSDDQDATSAKDAKTTQAVDAAPTPVDPTTLMTWPPATLAPATTALADKGTAADGADLGGDALGALRKGKGKGKEGDKGQDALLAGLGLGKDAAAPDAKATAAPGKGSLSVGDLTATLDKAGGAANAATGTRDSMAALLPQPDPTTLQAGTVGASPTALLDPNPPAAQAVPPAQATLPMAPQSPTFAPALGHQIEVWMRDGVQHAEVQLNPQDLGPIRVRIEMDGAQTRVQMSADVASTRDALQQALPQLSDSLGQVGLSLSGGGVSDQSTAQSQAQWAASGSGDAAGGAGGRGGSRTRGEAGDAGGEDVAVASAARQAAQRRGLLDLYA